MTGVLGYYKQNMRRNRVLQHNLVFHFRVKNDFHGKS